MRFALDDQIAARPEVVARIVSREMPCLDASRPVAELPRLRHTDPDPPHGGVEPWRSAMTSLEL